MQGIERIKQHILNNADAMVMAIQNDATAFEEQTIAASEEECRRIVHEAEESAQRDAELTIRRGESLADAEKRKTRLAHRQVIAGRPERIVNEEPEDLRVKRYAL